MFVTAAQQPLQRRAFEIAPPARDEIVVEVAGCGLCHTDLGFLSGAVQTRHQLPLVLGHEISGRVIAAGEMHHDLIDRAVVIPAVLPCGDCELCRAGRDNICQRQRMPGNDFNGGFASHVKVPARFVCPLPDDLGGFPLAELSVVADAITTPYESVLRSGLAEGELAVVIGVGGVGLYLVQHARNRGAHVVAIDIDSDRLAAAEQAGAELTVNAANYDPRELRKHLRQFASEHDYPDNRWRVFETSGTAAGQKTAYGLLSFAGSLGVVGFTMDKIELRLSNIMAFDATVFGNWGCSPRHYPAVVEQVLDGRIEVRANVSQFPLADINEVIDKANTHQLDARAVLVP
ncbi:MAG: 6-hydroxycyclohex-1-ene-1-carbonyl-CoA dehydrogenase [Pseudomonadota bacterium]|nr:MAG: 6-hydroxycyclohex-1-ene-1-carbonyl-CoA dehydrogenase [Pseudomonadota bacterium]